LSNLIVEGNTAINYGGGIGVAGGRLEMDHVTVYSNTANTGGGLGMTPIWASYRGFMRNSQVYSNTTTCLNCLGIGGGGIMLLGNDAQQSWNIESSAVYSNTAGDGAGIFNGNNETGFQLNVFDSSIHDNQATFDGGGIWNASSLAISRTTFSANHAGRQGGALYAVAGGTRDTQFPGVNSVDIAQSTFDHNFANYGGGIYHSVFALNNGHSDPFTRTQLTLLNSTLAINSGYHDGGGLYADGGKVNLLNTTIAGNLVDLDFPDSYTGQGGGLFITHTATITAQNTLIANNIRFFTNPLNHANDCFGTLVSLGFNLIRTTSNCNIVGNTGTNITSQDPLLGPLAYNGGATQTQALQLGSPAIDAGDPGGCTGDGGAMLTTDQRGAPRSDVRCDMGAYEVVPEADLSVSQRDSRDPVGLGAPLTYTMAVTNTSPVTATGVVLTDTLSLSATAWAVTPSQGSCLGTVTVVCNLGTLASGAHVTATLAVTPTVAGVITNTALVSANEFDPALANNTASETTAVVRELYLPLVTRGP
jgi:uncharacterized repeat protein (TIGR01451 family)